MKRTSDGTLKPHTDRSRARRSSGSRVRGPPTLLIAEAQSGRTRRTLADPEATPRSRRAGKVARARRVMGDVVEEPEQLRVKASSEGTSLYPGHSRHHHPSCWPPNGPAQLRAAPARSLGLLESRQRQPTAEAGCYACSDVARWAGRRNLQLSFASVPGAVLILVFGCQYARSHGRLTYTAP